MASSNKRASDHVFTDIQDVKPVEILRRQAVNCMLWEDNFYEDGVSLADRIKQSARKCTREELLDVLNQAKFENKLRHLPLYLLCVMAEMNNEVLAKRKKELEAEYKDTLGTKETNVKIAEELKKAAILTKYDVRKICTRVDDMTELVSIWWRDGKRPLPMPFKRGLKMTFEKFDEYQFAKYNGNNKALKLRDLERIIHPKPINKETKEEDKDRSALYKRITDNELATPDTWEVAISAAGTVDPSITDKEARMKKVAEQKKAAWIDLLERDKLPQLAFFKNLRNLKENVPEELLRQKLKGMDVSWMMPYNIIAAWRAVEKDYESLLDEKLLQSIHNEDFKPLPGKTLILLDSSGSMNSKLSSKGEISIFDAAAGVAAMAREVCETVDVYTFDEHAYKIPDRHGFALIEACGKPNGGTAIYTSLMEAMEKNAGNAPYDRVIIITDEQDNYYSALLEKTEDSDRDAPIIREWGVPNINRSKFNRLVQFRGKGYILNVGPYSNGVFYQKSSKWVHITGWSPSLIKYITAYESSLAK